MLTLVQHFNFLHSTSAQAPGKRLRSTVLRVQCTGLAITARRQYSAGPCADYRCDRDRTRPDGILASSVSSPAAGSRARRARVGGACHTARASPGPQDREARRPPTRASGTRPRVAASTTSRTRAVRLAHRAQGSFAQPPSHSLLALGRRATFPTACDGREGARRQRDGRFRAVGQLR